MMEIPTWVVYLSTWILFGIGFAIGLLISKNDRKYYQEKYNNEKEHIREKILKESRNEWNKGWDDCVKHYGGLERMSLTYLREKCKVSEKDVKEWYQELWCKGVEENGGIDSINRSSNN